jgi:hypothetical protein
VYCNDSIYSRGRTTKIPRRSGVLILGRLALTRLDFVATKVLLGFFVPCMCTSNWVIGALTKLVWVVLGVLGRVNTVTGKFADEADQFTLCILLCHLLLA